MIASHNSLTYLRPKKWWMRLFNFMAKCQSKTVKEQFEKYNTRMFDFRIDFNKEGELFVKHGLAVYDINRDEVIDFLRFLNRKKSIKYVMLTLECSKRESKELPLWKELEFIKFCEYVEKTFKNVQFIGGHAKHSWKRLYVFDDHSYEKFTTVSKFASVATKNKLDDLWPWLYAKRHNRKSIIENDSKYVWLDFVEIQ